MASKISNKTKQLIKKLHSEGLSNSEIAKRADISRTTVYSHTHLEERGFASPSEYKDYLARQKGFESDSEYQQHLYQTKDFESHHEYRKHLAKKRGFNSICEYREHLAKKQGYRSHYEHRKHLAKKRGYKSISEYQKHLAKKRQRRPINKKLSELINARLNAIGQNKVWLAEQLGIRKVTAYDYASGKSIPNDDILIKLFMVLRISHITLDDLLDE